MNPINVYNVSVLHHGTCLKNISFSVPDRVLFAVHCQDEETGSLLTEVLCGMRKPDSGSALLLGQKPFAVRRETGTAAVYRNKGSIFSDMKVGVFLYHSCRLHGMSKTFAKLYSQKLLDECCLRQYEELPCGRIPVTAARTAAIAASVCRDPAVLIADDPAEGLSAREADRMYDLLFAQSMKRTVAVVTRSAETLIHSQMAVIIRRGQTAFCGNGFDAASFAAAEQDEKA